jgi:hypothetical protein
VGVRSAPPRAVYYFADYEESKYQGRQRITRQYDTVPETVPTIWNLFERKPSGVTVNSDMSRDSTSAVMLPTAQGLLCVTANHQFLFYVPIKHFHKLFGRLGLLRVVLANFNLPTLWARSSEAEEFVVSLIVMGMKLKRRNPKIVRSVGRSEDVCSVMWVRVM